MSQFIRRDGRKTEEPREIKITRNFTRFAEGSILVETGDTVVLCNASVEDKIPPFLRGQGQGWVTAEYSLLPRSTENRTIREISRGRASGRTLEIQRLIGRCLRSVVDLKELGENTIWLDCDVIQADGGTRSASISGSFVALVDAVDYMLKNQIITNSPLKSFLAATSVGIVDGINLLDLSFEEDARAQVDLNMVMTETGDIIEIQGTAEGSPFSRYELENLLDLGFLGIEKMVLKQKESLGELVELVGKKENASRENEGDKEGEQQEDKGDSPGNQ